MNIIIVGCGKIGALLTEQLCMEGHNVSIIDLDRDIVKSVSNRYDVLGVVGNGAVSTTLIDAGIEKANLLIAMTGKDELNLMCCLIAKKISNCQTISRMQNPQYSKQINIIKEELGLSMTINPEYVAAKEVAKLLRFPSAVKVETFAKGRVEILKYKIPTDSKLQNLKLYEISSKLNCNVLVCAVERGQEVIIPNGQFQLMEGDLISIVATPQKANEFFHKLGVVKGKVKNIMIVGGGGISYYLVKQLENMGIGVTIIEKNEERCRFLSEELSKAVVIHGDGINQDILDEEGIKNIDAFAAMTNLDEVNILMTLYAKTQANAKVITKVHTITYSDVIESMKLDSIICPKNIVAECVIQYVRAMQNSIGSNVETLYKIIENKAEALEFIVRRNSEIIGVPLEKLKLRDGVIISCIHRNNTIIIPKGKDTIQLGDSVIIVTKKSGMDDITDILEK
ncbi:Trk system potassium transporter TrkA [Anaerosporobacter faecicola]|uniref:Trk system potassium transporter TrkA n=1 Tax=Anaerosporobacter faecicola TaxID=2718714 RepID=UPI00143A2E28|nr:Trk system potassium transporter TrkA [Anaerosporobacter faecicola]